ncbi:Conserved_hypothetical protein [Hexamita inflata]|uniref:Uncharacterized protein n=1 Tax=Hexamita inflata TaxID=28002 RepID=A0AA86PWP2_9EUKA|nr:Conserved hypothetical protein [Hexamita inflata]
MKRPTQPTWTGDEYDIKMTEQCNKMMSCHVLCFDNQLFGQYNYIKSIEFMKNLDIYRLELKHCRYIIQKFKSDTLRELLLDSCDLKSIDELPLENLEVLELIDYNSFKFFAIEKDSKLNINCITQCKQLKQLRLQNYKNIDLAPVSKLITLTKLDLENCYVKSLDVLAPLINLEELILSGNQGINLKAINYFQQLNTLQLESCAIYDKEMEIYDSINLSPLKTLKQLQNLNLSSCNILHIKALKSITTLKHLVINHNPGIDITPLQFLIQLEKLEMEDCKIKDLSILKQLVKLKELNVNNNYNLNITAIQHLKKLTDLNISMCNVRDITVLSTLTNLENLSMDTNPVFYYSPIFQLKLKRLECSNSTPDLDKYISLRKVYYISLCGNSQNFTRHDLVIAKKLKKTNAPISQLKKLIQQRASFKSMFNTTKVKVGQILSFQMNNQIVFTAKVATLLGALNEMN